MNIAIKNSKGIFVPNAIPIKMEVICPSIVAFNFQEIRIFGAFISYLYIYLVFSSAASPYKSVEWKAFHMERTFHNAQFSRFSALKYIYSFETRLHNNPLKSGTHWLQYDDGT